MFRLFEAPAHARYYSKFRPETPNSLIERVVQYVQQGVRLKVAVDVGCGSGQNTRLLAAHCTSVLATDISAAQIAEARAAVQPDNVQFRESPAEVIPAADGSVQLVTASQSCHFFDVPRFFAEADRVLAPGGVLAIYGYDMPEPYVDGEPCAELDRVISQALEPTKPYRFHTRGELARKYADNKYRMPYPEEIREEHHYREMPLTVDSVLGMINSWSGFQLMVKELGTEAGQRILQRARDGVLVALAKVDQTDTGAANVTTRYYYFMVMARKPVVS